MGVSPGRWHKHRHKGRSTLLKQRSNNRGGLAGRLKHRYRTLCDITSLLMGYLAAILNWVIPFHLLVATMWLKSHKLPPPLITEKVSIFFLQRSSGINNLYTTNHNHLDTLRKLSNMDVNLFITDNRTSGPNMTYLDLTETTNPWKHVWESVAL